MTVTVKPEKMTIKVVQKYSAKELHKLREDLVRALTEEEDQESARSEAMQKHKAGIARARTEAKRLKNACAAGEEEREIRVAMIRNFQKSRREYLDYDDDNVVNEYGGLGSLGKIIKTEPLTPADHKLEMDLLEEENRRREDEQEDETEETPDNDENGDESAEEESTPDNEDE
ncbi:MAG: hypothetical protein J3T61_10260 [Candidatus Brocadiales bacterium]|nr:hypothetical protein [Candidatus Bathyanammoxibius sp.]